jgi:cell division protein FtsB
VLVIIVVFMSISVYHRFTVEREMSVRRAEMEEERQQLIERKAELEERVDYLSGDRGIEEEIRTHFDVAKEGEQVVIIVDKEEEQKPEIPVIPEKKPWYIFW